MFFCPYSLAETETGAALPQTVTYDGNGSTTLTDLDLMSTADLFAPAPSVLQDVSNTMNTKTDMTINSFAQNKSSYGFNFAPNISNCSVTFNFQ